MKNFSLLTLIVFTAFMGLIYGCKKDGLVIVTHEQKLKALLDSTIGRYKVRRWDYWGVGPLSNHHDSLYPEPYYLELSAELDTVLLVDVLDSANNNVGSQYSLTLSTGESTEYDPSIFFYYSTGYSYYANKVFFFSNDSVSFSIVNGSLAGSYSTTYYGTKIP